MWKTSIIGLISFVCFPSSVKAVDKCLLDVSTYMSFLVRVVDIEHEPKTISTGSIITPIHVLSTCIELNGKQPFHLQARACQVHYSPGKIDENHFVQAGSDEDPKGCIQIRNVKEVRKHPRCPKPGTDEMKIYTEEYTRYNVAILPVTEAFRNYTEAVPAMPFISDVGVQLAIIDDFNTLRTVRCEIPLYFETAAKSRYHPDMNFRSIPLHLECINHLCKDQPAACNETVNNSTGFILCARRVLQPESGITWNDYEDKDKNFYRDDADQCFDLKHTVGAPLMCRGSAIGIVTQCNTFGMVISTIFTLRVFIHPVIDEGYTEEVIYMDTTGVPTESRVRSNFYPESFQERTGELIYSNSNPVHQDLILKRLVLLVMHVVFLLLNEGIMY